MERELQTALLVNPSCLIGRDRSPKSNADHGIIGQPAETGAVFVLRPVGIEHNMTRNSVSARAAFSGVTSAGTLAARRRLRWSEPADDALAFVRFQMASITAWVVERGREVARWRIGGAGGGKSRGLYPRDAAGPSAITGRRWRDG